MHTQLDIANLQSGLWPSFTHRSCCVRQFSTRVAGPIVNFMLCVPLLIDKFNIHVMGGERSTKSVTSKSVGLHLCFF